MQNVCSSILTAYIIDSTTKEVSILKMEKNELMFKIKEVLGHAIDGATRLSNGDLILVDGNILFSDKGLKTSFSVNNNPYEWAGCAVVIGNDCTSALSSLEEIQSQVAFHECVDSETLSLKLLENYEHAYIPDAEMLFNSQLN